MELRWWIQKCDLYGQISGGKPHVFEVAGFLPISLLKSNITLTKMMKLCFGLCFELGVFF